jgi:lipopolysaccharide transport system ATP-binding protein
MSSEPALRVDGISKLYELYGRPQDRLKQFLWRGRRRLYRELWALHEVSLEVRRGEIVAIVGRNGSGKSTLLQIIAGTVAPTAGTVSVNGRVSALLELGAGFNPEFTGRENVYLNGALAGLSRSEVDERFADIVGFAELQDFIEQPVKTYSSGMFVRLAFSIAVNVDPDILLVDEALAVGDEAFQRKCYQRIDNMRRRGATVVFVSHSAQIVADISDRAVLLDEGECLLTGSPKGVLSRYHKLIFAPPARMPAIRQEIKNLDAADLDAEPSERVELSGSPEQPAGIRAANDGYQPGLRPSSTLEYPPVGARIEDVHLENRAGERVNLVTRGGFYWYVYRVAFTTPAFRVRFGMMIKNLIGAELGGMVSHAEGSGIDYVPEGCCLEVRFPIRARLSPGTYFTNAGALGLVDGEERFLHRIIDGAMFRVAFEVGLRVTGLVDLTDGPAVSIEEVSELGATVRNP